jgi:hypothetical protein
MDTTISDIIRLCTGNDIEALNFPADIASRAPYCFTEETQIFEASPEYVLIPVLASDELEAHAARMRRGAAAGKYRDLDVGHELDMTRRMTRYERHGDPAATESTSRWL